MDSCQFRCFRTRQPGETLLSRRTGDGLRLPIDDEVEVGLVQVQETSCVSGSSSSQPK